MPPLRFDKVLIADEPDSFAHAMLGLLDDAAQYQRIRLAARRLVENRYDWQVVGDIAQRALHDIRRPPRQQRWPAGPLAETPHVP